MDSNIFNSQQIRYMSETNKNIWKQQPIAFNHKTYNHSQYYNHNANFTIQSTFKNAERSYIENISSYQNSTSRGMQKVTIQNIPLISTISKIIPYSSHDLLKNKNHTQKIATFNPTSSFHMKPKNFSNSKSKKNKIPTNQIQSQRLELVGNISPRQNHEGKARFQRTYYNFQDTNNRGENNKLKTQGASFDKQFRTSLSPPQIQSASKFSKKSTSKKIPKASKNSQQFNFKKSITSFPLCLKNRSKTFETNNQFKSFHENGLKSNKFQDQNALQFRDAQTRRESECSSSKNENQLKSPAYFKTRQTTNNHKQVQTQQMKSSLAKATKELGNQNVVNKLLKQRLQAVDLQHNKKQQRMKKLQKQLSILKRKSKEYSLPKSKSKQKQSRHSEQGNSMPQYQAEKKWLKQQILLLNMTHKKFASLIQQKDHQIQQLTKKLQEKQYYCQQLQRSSYHKSKNNVDYSRQNQLPQLIEDNATSMIIRNDISNDFDPLEGYNIELDYLKMQNHNLLQLLRKAEEEIQRLKSQNIRLRYQNQNSQSKKTNKSFISDSNAKPLPQNKHPIQTKKFLDFTVQQCYKQVLQIFGITTDITNQFPKCHNELMNEIDYFKKSLLEMLQQMKQAQHLRLEEYHKPQTSKKQIKQKISDMTNQLKVQLQQSIQINHGQVSGLELDKNFYTKQELEKILINMNERIESLEPQIQNKFGHLIRRLYNIVRILCQKFGPQLEQKLIQLIHKDEVLSEYAPF